MRQLLGRPLMALIVPGSTCAITAAQDSARTFQGGVTGCTPAGRLNLQAAMNDPAGADADSRARRSAAHCANKRGISLTAPLSAAYYQSSRNYPFNGDGLTCGRQA